MAIEDRLVEYQDGDATLEGYLAYDSSATEPRPCVVIAHAWGGRSEFECDKARKLAAEGYTAFAADVFGKGISGSGPEENAALMQPFLDDRALLQRRIQLAVEIAGQQAECDGNRVAAIGYCFGGLTVLDLARTGVDIRAVVSIHGLFVPPGNTEGTPIRAKVLCQHGHEDPMVPPDSVLGLEKELTEAGADWQIHVYGNTFHAFTNPEANDPGMGVIYNPSADQRSWQSLLNFLAEVLE